jgi:hypothetical protein
VKLENSCNTSHKYRSRREKYRALLLVKWRYSVKMGLLRNTTVVDDAITFVSL